MKKKKQQNIKNKTKLKSIKSVCHLISDSSCLARIDLNIEDLLQVCCNSYKWMHAFCVSLGEKSAEDL